jgi:hypothetical protein
MTVNNVLEGHMLWKNPREQMTNRDVLHFFHTQMPNPNCMDGVTLMFSNSRLGIYWCSLFLGTIKDYKQHS